MKHSCLQVLPVILSSALFLLYAPAAQAYIGPGGGLSALGALLALIAALVIAFIGFIWYPLRRLRRKLKARADGQTETAAVDSHD